MEDCCCDKVSIISVVIVMMKSRELETEIRKMNQDEFKWGVNWQQVKC